MNKLDGRHRPLMHRQLAVSILGIVHVGRRLERHKLAERRVGLDIARLPIGDVDQRGARVERVRVLVDDRGGVDGAVGRTLGDDRVETLVVVDMPVPVSVIKLERQCRDGTMVQLTPRRKRPPHSRPAVSPMRCAY